VAQGIVLKNRRNKAFSALILSLGLIAGLISTATPAKAAVYAITWDDNGATTASSGRQASYDTGTPGTWAVPTTPPVRTGYTFAAWTTSASGGTAWNFNTKPTGPITYYAKWNAGSITWNAQGGSTTSGGTASNFAGWPVANLRAEPTRSGYTFVGWFDAISAGNQVIAGTYIPSSASGGVTFYARWSANTLAVTYNSQSGSAISNGSTSVGGSISSSPGTPIRDNYGFLGWYAASTGGSAITFPYTHAQTANFTLYAQWESVPNSILWDDNFPSEPGDAAGDSDGQYNGAETYVNGSPIGEANGEADGERGMPSQNPFHEFYNFAGWWTSTSGGDEVTATYVPQSPYGPVTFYARWTAKVDLTVSYDSQGGSAIDEGLTTTGGSISSSPGTPTRDDYTFSGWFAASTGGSAITFPYTHAKRGDFTLYAQWTANQNNDPVALTVTYNTQSGSSISNGSTSVGGSISSSPGTPTRSGYTFNGWFAASTGGSAITFPHTHAQTANFTLYAQWTANTLAITYNSQSGSSISNGSTSTGGSISSSPGDPTRSGYTFNGWFAASTGGSAITFPHTHAQTANFTLYAQWTANQADNTNTVTWNGQGATTASSGGSTTYTNGSSVSTIPTTAPQKTGHTFVGWFTAASSGKQITNGSFTPASPYVNQTFYAHWTVNRTSSVGTWAWTNQSSAGSRKWHALATSADGSKLYAGVDDGGSLYRSTDFGVTWSVIADTSGKNWFSIASNIDGTKVAAVDRGGHIWTSTDSGSTWTQRSVGAVRNWESIASSSDGSKLVAVASNGDSNGFIYTSSNSGVSWSSNLAPAGTNKFTGVASSNDGTYLAATTWANGIYTSSNSGQTWTARTLPVPNSGSTTYLQAVASSGDGSRLVTGSRTLAGGSNGGVIFTSADYGVTWKAFSQTNLDYINFTSNGDGSRLAATVYDQTGVSTSADYGATWTFQSVGLSGEIPIASNIDGSLLFVGAYGGNLWTGKIPNARVVAVLPASTTAALAATASTPATELSFSASSAAAAVTVTPITNPATEAATPFSAAQASVFDISVVNVTGQVTVCVDGGPNVRLWHYTNGAWVDVTTSQSATQTCGLTSSFSPFATALSVTVSLPVTNTVSNAASERREAEKQSARTEIASTLQSAKDLTVESFAKAEIRGVTDKNLAAVQAEILALPEESRADINQILKVARKFEVVGNIASNQVMRMTANSFVEIGLIPATSKSKVALMAAIRKLPASARDTYAEIKAAIEAETARIKSRNDRLAAIVNRKTTKSTQK
jgi:uncharacterized repeat protein (TIGR02543 family)